MRISRAKGRYRGARLYFIVGYGVRAGEKADRIHYSRNPERAEALFEQFQQDIIDPSALGGERT